MFDVRIDRTDWRIHNLRACFTRFLRDTLLTSLAAVKVQAKRSPLQSTRVRILSLMILKPMARGGRKSSKGLKIIQAKLAHSKNRNLVTV